MPTLIMACQHAFAELDYRVLEALKSYFLSEFHHITSAALFVCKQVLESANPKISGINDAKRIRAPTYLP